jgi:hypothetical protein
MYQNICHKYATHEQMLWVMALFFISSINWSRTTNELTLATFLSPFYPNDKPDYIL